MSTTIAGTQRPLGTNVDGTTPAGASAQVAQAGTTVPQVGEGALQKLALLQKAGEMLPTLPAPKVTGSTGGTGLLTSGLSLEVLLDAVGMEQRRTEAKAGVSAIEARAQERKAVNDEKIAKIQEQLEKSKKGGFLGKLLKAFKIIGMIVGAIASVAMIAVGAVGLAAGGSGVALIAVGTAMFALTVSMALEEGTGGKAGFSPSFITGKIMEASGASEKAVTWTKFAVDLATSIVLIACSLGAGAATAGAKGAQAAADGASKAAQAAQVAGKVAKGVSTASSIASGATTMAQGGVGIANAVNERDIANLQADQKRLQAILERISMANDLDLEHVKEMLERSERTLQQVSDIVAEGAKAQTALLTGTPAMA